MSKNKTVRNAFLAIFCFFTAVSLAYAESCSSSGATETKYTASGCSYTTQTRTCCSNGYWSDWGGSCTYCAGNATYDYGWFRGVCYKDNPLSCNLITLSDRTWGGGPGDNETGWGLSCGCPDGASVTITQRMYADNKTDVTMACYDHQLKPVKNTTSTGGLGEVSATSSSSALTLCKNNYTSVCNTFISNNITSKWKKCTTTTYSCNQSNSSTNYYHDCYTSYSSSMRADSSGTNKYMCVCDVTYYTVTC